MSIARGLVAGAAGTVTLHVITYLDMAVRGRAASAVPARSVARMADAAGVDLAPAGDGDAERHRQEGIGALLGYASGLGLGVLYGVVRDRTDGQLAPARSALGLALAAMASGNLAAISLRVTDPREWGLAGWLADILPHTAYGVVTAGVYDAIDTRPRSGP